MFKEQLELLLHLEEGPLASKKASVALTHQRYALKGISHHEALALTATKENISIAEVEVFVTAWHAQQAQQGGE